MRRVTTKDGRLLLVPEEMSKEEVTQLAYGEDPSVWKKLTNDRFPEEQEVFTLANLPNEEVSAGIDVAFPDGVDIEHPREVANGDDAKEELPSWANLMSRYTKSVAPQLALGAAEGAAEFPINLANLLLPKGAQIPQPRHGEGFPYEAGRTVGDIASFIGAGGPARGLLKGAAAIPGLGRGAKALLAAKSGFKAAPRRALGAGAYGAVQSPEDRVGGAAAGALASGAIDVAGSGIGTMLPKERVSRIAQRLRERWGGNWANILKERGEQVEGLEMPIGKVLDDAALHKFYENVISKSPLSGAEHSYSRTKRKLIDEGNELIGKYTGEAEPHTVDQNLAEEIKGVFDKEQKAKRTFYKKADNLARKHGISVNFKNTKEVLGRVGENINELDKQISGNKETHYRYEMLKKALKNDSIKSSPAQMRSLSNNLDKVAGRVKLAGGDSSHLIGLADAAKQDARVAERKGPPEVKKLYDEAHENYGKNFAPFKDKKIREIVFDETNPEDIVSKFVNMAQGKDAVTNTKKLTSILSDKGDKLLKHAMLKRAGLGEIDDLLQPTQLKKVWKGLGAAQKLALFPDKSERKAWDKYSKRVELNDTALKNMFNPKTGSTLLEPHMLAGLLGMSFATPLLGATAVASAPIARYRFTSPVVREKLIKRLLKSRDIPKGTEKQKREFIQQLMKPSVSSGVGNVFSAPGEFSEADLDEDYQHSDIFT